MSHPQSLFQQSSFHGKSMLSLRRDTIATTTIHTQLEQLRNTGRYDCFKLEWHAIYADKSMWPVPFHLFWDSDIAKWIEGACYLLQETYDEKIDLAIRELVAMIRSAQGEDGYLNVHYTVVEPDKRWSNLRDMHELYNAGHLIEAALAHRAHYNNDLLLEPIVKYVALINKTFGPGQDQRHGYPGHPEIELALLRLYSATKSEDAYNLAKYFLEERGNPNGQDGQHYYDWEEKQRGDSEWLRPDPYPERHSYWYAQAHAPILEQSSVEGHSVRAMYLLAAAADMVCLHKQGSQNLPAASEWTAALNRLWDNMVDKKMYVTGGIGAMKQWEGFGIDYFLPQGADDGGCYSETCASIAVMMLAERMLHINLDSRYADIMELSLYNNVMTAMSLDGKAFTYVNQLASSDQDKNAREDWFWCACCPPNLARLFGSLGGYLWDYGGSGNDAFVTVHLYTTAKVTFDLDGKSITLEQKSNWPWDGVISFRLEAPAFVRTTIRLRLPAWCQGQYEITPAPSVEQVQIFKGYLTLDSAYGNANPSFKLQIKNFGPRYIAPHPYTNQNTLALARGPIIYCAEDADNAWEKNHFKDVVIRAGSAIEEERRTFDETGEEYLALRTTCSVRSMKNWNEKPVGEEPGTSQLDDSIGEIGEQRDIVLVPYYFRANRGGRGHMRVGLLKG
ncbi:hypothetical protein LEL_05685 [Akanthomyces lecanii RCEF 1005]|uniref:DUF1680 domain protein n=1 Tax=Akanthomyces lecanii RCEF 1005 TaxID=1081108 RepID=A0A168G461_CORDF|nr:hypothetical protein LEL_05685 [Akanthomyces lecanii RCEF 1005]